MAFLLGIEFTIRADPLSVAMLARYVAFLSPSSLRRWTLRMAQRSSRPPGLLWQIAMLRQGKWAVYFDGNCGFCRRWVSRARRIAIPQVQWRDFNLHREEVAHLNPRFDQAAYLIIDQRFALPGFRGFRRLLLAMPLLWIVLPLVYLPGSRWIGDAIYRYISMRHGSVKPERS